MKRKDTIKFFAVIVIVAILASITFFDVSVFLSNLFNTEIEKIQNAEDIRTGIDIRGGIDVKLFAEAENPSLEDLESAKVVIGKRLDNKFIFDRVITVDENNGAVIVQIPLKKGEDLGEGFNPQAIIEELGKTAQLTFREVIYVSNEEPTPEPTTEPTEEPTTETTTEPTKETTPEPTPASSPVPTTTPTRTFKTVLDGTYVENTSAKINPQTGEWEVHLKFDNEGTEIFEEVTGRLVGKELAIFMDNQEISSPVVKSKIPGGEAVISGGFKMEDAFELSRLIKSGSLPFNLEAKQISSISPSLGEHAFNVSKRAGLIAFLLVCLFLLIMYRLPGILSIVALVGLVSIQLLFISYLGITLTLPGILGIILSFGMGVDANILIFERIKEEINKGKTLRAAIDIGFSKAFKAILDANMTTLISAFVIFLFGTGTVISFAYTLSLGVILSFITAITVSRIMLKSISAINIARKPWLYGAKGEMK